MDTPLRNLAVIGAGAMGSGIAALFASKGLNVVLIDSVDGALDRALKTIERQLNVYAPGEVQQVIQRIRMEQGLEAAAASDLVIEAVPENLDLKRGIFAKLDSLCPASTLFATNTSGLSINAIASAVVRRDRFVGTHFFTPADVIPLVEVVRNDATSADTVARVMATLRLGGKRPVLVRQDIPGFIANRLQEALWREALHMVAGGEATVRDIDRSITEGPGLRWAVMGPMLTFALAGGEGGMAHMLDHFGPSLKSPWTRLEAPELDKELYDAVVAGCDEAADGRSIADLVAERDKGVIDVLRATGRLGREGEAR